MNVLFLYSELAAYTLACLHELSTDIHVNVCVVHYPVNKEAPFIFEQNTKVKFLDKKEVVRTGLNSLVKEFSPHIVFCSGWADKDYLAECKLLKKRKIPVVLCMDNKWELNWRKLAAVASSFLFIKPHFTYAWVPGKAQALYASRLGFPENKIFTGFYCADTKLWGAWFDKFVEDKKKFFPKRILYAGRYYDFKGLPELWSAFIEFRKTCGADWELWCAGTGTLAPVEHDGIKHLGFVQPKDMEALVKQCGVFVFPSRFEPWGVAVQEFAAAGFPLLLSTQVGAGEEFLETGINGFIFESENKTSLLTAFIKLSELSREEMIEMSYQSHKRGMAFTPSSWVNKLKSIAKSSLG